MPTASEISNAFSLLAPGFLIVSIRLRFKDGARPTFKEGLMSYAFASSAYYAAFSPVFHVNGSVELPYWLWSLLYFFVMPCLIGLAVMFIDQREWAYALAHKLKLTLPHHIPAAWDYALSRTGGPKYVILKLRDGTKYAGIYGSASFASSSKEERDILLEDVWDLNESGAWTRLDPPRSLLVCGGDISWIEIFR
ncbi:DUF6338 family protein [Sphingomonas sp. R1]|uniref:DUF6338 family protein n=1 Tax=Sphingomonas sp. R1 TaxID=399176 RepID=UPI0022250B38|nr:DUF6338 family protein [Sphingomonas sp. R1]UYY79259.1 DUF6338 family protein [Sphingomonas sp. R1]